MDDIPGRVGNVQADADSTRRGPYQFPPLGLTWIANNAVDIARILRGMSREPVIYVVVFNYHWPAMIVTIL